MADNVTPRVRVPRDARPARSFRSHADQPPDGKRPAPRRGWQHHSAAIINRFTCDFNGENVIDVTLEPAISTNPYFQFEAVVNETGTFQFTWYDDDGSVYEETADITVS
jgi:sulfur-oxidizing protein SoxZ